MSRLPAGTVRFRDSQGGWRKLPFAMNSAIEMCEGEWLEAVWTDRPVRISDRSLPLMVLPQAPQLWTPDPWVLCGPRRLRFNRLGPS